MTMPVVQLLQSMLGLSSPSSSDGAKGLFTATDKAVGLGESQAGGEGQFNAVFEKAFQAVSNGSSESLSAPSDDAVSDLLASVNLSGPLPTVAPSLPQEGVGKGHGVHTADGTPQDVEAMDAASGLVLAVHDPVETARMTLKAEAVQQDGAEHPWPRLPLGILGHASAAWRMQALAQGKSGVFPNHQHASALGLQSRTQADAHGALSATEQESLVIEELALTTEDGAEQALVETAPESLQNRVTLHAEAMLGQRGTHNEEADSVGRGQEVSGVFSELQVTTDVFSPNPAGVPWMTPLAQTAAFNGSVDAETHSASNSPLSMEAYSESAKPGGPALPEQVAQHSQATLPERASERAKAVHGSSTDVSSLEGTTDLEFSATMDGQDGIALSANPEGAVPLQESPPENPLEFMPSNPVTTAAALEAQGLQRHLNKGQGTDRPFSAAANRWGLTAINTHATVSDAVHSDLADRFSEGPQARYDVDQVRGAHALEDDAGARTHPRSEVSSVAFEDALNEVAVESAETAALGVDSPEHQERTAAGRSEFSEAASLSAGDVSSVEPADMSTMVQGVAHSNGAHAVKATHSGVGASVAQQVTDATLGAAINNQSKVTLTLNPDELGTVRINLIQRNTGHGQAAQLHARIVVSSPEAQKLLSQQMARLGETLSEHNIRLENIQVLVAEHSGVASSSASAQAQSQSQQHSRQEDSQQQQQSSQQHNGHSFQDGSQGQGSSSRGWGGQAQERRPEFNLADVARGFNSNLTFTDLLNREQTRPAVPAGRINIPQTHESAGSKHPLSKGGASRPT